MALDSVIEPCVGPHTVNDATVTRMPSNSSSESSGFVVSDACVVSAPVIVIGTGKGLPLESSNVVGDVESSVTGGLFGFGQLQEIDHLLSD